MSYMIFLVLGLILKWFLLVKWKKYLGKQKNIKHYATLYKINKVCNVSYDCITDFLPSQNCQTWDYSKELITIHDISKNNINYKNEHYIEGLKSVLNNKEQAEIEKLAKENLERLKGLN